MMLAVVAIGFVFGSFAGALALANGAGILLALVSYGAAGSLAILVPLLVQAMFPDAEQDAWKVDAHETAGA